MAHYLKESNRSADKYVAPSSRYNNSQVIYYTEKRLIAFKIYKRKQKWFNDDDKWFEITPDVELRPDLVSTDFYGSPDFWWKIMEANKMKDILEFKAGRNIRLPGSIFA